jgi:hypothetical protein
VGISTPATASGSTKSPASSNGNADWRSRLASAKQWISANRLASLLAALILLSLLVYLILALRGRQKNGYKAKSAKTPKVQPRHSAGEELRPIVRETAAPKPAAQSAAAGSNAVTANVSTRPKVVSTPASQPEQINEQEDREVFEL